MGKGGGGGGVMLGMPGRWATDRREPSDHFTSKIGGLPDWPAWPLENLDPHLLQCRVCGTNLCLVAQVYAPVSGVDSSIDERLVLVFGCATPKCGTSPLSWRAIRIQKSAGEAAPDIDSRELGSGASVSASKTSWLDDDSGDEEIDLAALGEAFSRVESSSSGSKVSQQNGRCGTGKMSSASQSSRIVDMETPVLPCFYVYAQAEPSSTDVTSISLNYSTLSIKENQNDSEDHESEAWGQEDYEYDKALNADRTCLKFKKKVDANPEQCLRYSYGGKPLLATADLGDPGKCKLCGASRHYEMQLMPALIYFLLEAADESQRSALENWDWMTLLVYTCSKGCSVSSNQSKSATNSWTVAEDAVLVQLG